MSGNRGIGIFGVLTILFVVLKLTGNIDWSWWWVLAPLLISAGFFVVVTLVMRSAGRRQSE